MRGAGGSRHDPAAGRPAVHRHGLALRPVRPRRAGRADPGAGAARVDVRPVRRADGDGAAVSERCVVCGRDELDDGQRQTCTRCVGVARRSLIRVEQLYALLPHELTARAGTAPAMDLSGVRSGADPVMGGDVMVMLGPGSTRWHSDPVDSDSLLGWLERWEADWRVTFGDGAATGPATVPTCTLYLLRRLSRAAQEHPAFDEFASDLRDKRHRVEQALNLVQARSPVPCMTCGRRALVRPAPRPDGRVFEWQCQSCRRNYTQAEFWQAVRWH